jgi:hypothetical protein
MFLALLPLPSQETYAELARSKADAKEKEYKSLKDDSIIPRAYRQL